MARQPKIGVSTAAETAWYDQELEPEVAPPERPLGARRIVLVTAIAGVVISGGLALAALLASPSRGGPRAAIAAAPAANVAGAPSSPEVAAATNAPVEASAAPAAPATSPAPVAVAAAQPAKVTRVVKPRSSGSARPTAPAKTRAKRPASPAATRPKLPPPPAPRPARRGGHF